MRSPSLVWDQLEQSDSKGSRAQNKMPKQEYQGFLEALNYLSILIPNVPKLYYLFF